MKASSSLLLGATTLVIIGLFSLESLSGSWVLRGSLLPSTPSSEERIVSLCDTTPRDGEVTIREMKHGLIRILQGVMAKENQMDFTGDGITNRLDLVRALAVFSTLLSCGNGIVDAHETCDDARRKSGDGCSAVCGIETGYTCINSPTPSRCVPLGLLSCTAPEVPQLSFVSEPTLLRISQPIDGYTGTQSLLFRSFSKTTNETLENGRSVMIGGYTTQDSSVSTGLGYVTHEAVLDRYGTVLFSLPPSEHAYDLALAPLVGNPRTDIILALFGGTSLGTTFIAVDLDTGVRTSLFSLPSLPSSLSFAPHDLDLDGDIDIAITMTSTSTSETLWMENIDGTHFEKRAILSRGGTALAITPPSIDGLPDILLQTSSSTELLRQVRSCVLPVVRPAGEISSVRIAPLSTANTEPVAALGQRHVLEWMSNETLSTDLTGANLAYAIEYSLDDGASWKHFYYQSFGGLAFPNKSTRTAAVWVAGQQGERVGDTIRFRVSAVDQLSVPATFSRTTNIPSLRLLPASNTSNALRIVADCGNGVVDAGEACDNDVALSYPITSSDRGGHIPPLKGDGCSDVCTIETGYTCSSVLGSTSTCSRPSL
jgi:cysteine-rich repeat protein